MIIDGLRVAAVLLGLAGVSAVVLASGTRFGVRVYLHLSATLAFSLAVAALLGLAPRTVSWIVLPVCSVSLSLAAKAGFRHPAKPAVAITLLLLFAVTGISAAFGGPVWFAAVPGLAAVFAILVIARRGVLAGRGPSILLALGGGALGAALLSVAAETLAAGPLWSVASLSGSVLIAPVLFLAAGLTGSSLAVAKISDTLVLVPVRRRSRR